MARPLVTVVPSRAIAVCPFCSEETDFAPVESGGYRLGAHRLPPPEFDGVCPDSNLVFDPLNAEEPEA